MQLKKIGFSTRRGLTVIGAAALIAVAGGCATGSLAKDSSSPVPAVQRDRPNIVFILIDDLGWKDLSYSGSEFYETPAIDRLAREGVVFDNAYAAYPRCVPSRFALMTGKNPAREQIPGGPGGEAMAPEEYTIAEALKDTGYATYFLGKWHLGKSEEAWPEAQGFDVNIGGGSAGAVGSHFFPYTAEKNNRLGPGLETGKPGEYLTDRLTDETIRLIGEHEKSKPNQPFFLYLSHYSVHTPLQSKPELKKYYDAKLAKIGGKKQPAYADKDGQTKLHQDNAVYAGMVASVDESVGRIRAELRRLGISDNTIIVFTSDHGGLSNRGAQGGREVATSNLPLRAGKGHVYEGGTKVPMIVYWPGQMKAGSINHTFTMNTDHYATLLAAAGGKLDPSKAVDSLSYLAEMKGAKGPAGRAGYWYDSAPRPTQTGDRASAAIRIDGWKFIKAYDPTQVDELFDLSTDPYELSNLAQSDPKRAASMETRLEQWLASVDAVKPKLGRGGEKNRAGKGGKNADAKREARRAARKAARQSED